MILIIFHSFLVVFAFWLIVFFDCFRRVLTGYLVGHGRPTPRKLGELYTVWKKVYHDFKYLHFFFFTFNQTKKRENQIDLNEDWNEKIEENITIINIMITNNKIKSNFFLFSEIPRIPNIKVCFHSNQGQTLNISPFCNVEGLLPFSSRGKHS